MSAPLLLSHLLAELRERLPDALAAVLAGEITCRDAHMLLEGASPHTLSVLVESYEACKGLIRVRHPGLLEAFPSSPQELEEELATTLILVADLFREGEITLLQARYAVELALDGEQVQKCITRSNARRTTFFAGREREALLAELPEVSRSGLSATPTEHLRAMLEGSRFSSSV